MAEANLLNFAVFVGKGAQILNYLRGINPSNFLLPVNFLYKVAEQPCQQTSVSNRVHAIFQHYLFEAYVQNPNQVLNLVQVLFLSSQGFQIFRSHVVADRNLVQSGKALTVKSHHKGKVLDEAIDFLFGLFGFRWKIEGSQHLLEVVEEIFVIGVFFDDLVDGERDVADFVTLL